MIRKPRRKRSEQGIPPGSTAPACKTKGPDTNIGGAVKSVADAVAHKIPADAKADLVRKIFDSPSNGVVAACRCAQIRGQCECGGVGGVGSGMLCV